MRTLPVTGQDELGHLLIVLALTCIVAGMLAIRTTRR